MLFRRWTAVLMGVALLVGCSDDGGAPCTSCDAQVLLENTPTLCQDGVDNDFDSFVDCVDQDCWGLAVCQPDGSTPDGGVDGPGPLPDGPLPDGPLPDGPLPDGPLPDGPLPDGPLPDGPAPDGPLPDGPLPDVQQGDAASPWLSCPTGCGQDQVCLKGVCTDVGPAKDCGTAKYGVNLPGANLLHVDGAYSGTSDGSAAKPYTSITAALAAIPATGATYTLAVAEGTYQETLTITKNVDLRCRCPSKVTVAGSITVQPPVGSSGLTVTIDGCTVAPAGFAIPPTDWGACDTTSPEDPKGIYAKGSTSAISLLIKDSVVAGWCIGVYFNAAPVSSSSFCLARSTLDANVRGIDVQTAPTVAASAFSECQQLAEGVAARLSRIGQSKDYGVHTRINAQGIALEANLVERSGRVGSKTGGLGYGVYLGDSDTAQVAANRIRDNTGRGLGLRNLQVLSATKIQIADNAFSSNNGAAIALQQLQAAKDTKVIGNVIDTTGIIGSTPGGDAIQVSVENGPAFNVTVQDNIILNSQRNGIIIDEAGGTISGNAISASGGYGILLQQSSATVDATNTYLDNLNGNLLSTSTVVHPVGSLPIPIP